MKDWISEWIWEVEQNLPTLPPTFRSTNYQDQYKSYPSSAALAICPTLSSSWKDSLVSLIRIRRHFLIVHCPHHRPTLTCSSNKCSHLLSKPSLSFRTFCFLVVVVASWSNNPVKISASTPPLLFLHVVSHVEREATAHRSAAIVWVSSECSAVVAFGA